MNVQTIAPVRESVEVSAPLPLAFEVFTARLASWCPASHRIAAEPFVDAVIEPRSGGRWFERDAEGRECDWGQVLAFEPPHRLMLSWAISSDFRHEPDPARASEIEIRFRALDEHRTVVELEHRHFERHGTGGRQMRGGVASPGGWPGVLARFADAAFTREPDAQAAQQAAGLPLPSQFARFDHVEITDYRIGSSALDS